MAHGKETPNAKRGEAAGVDGVGSGEGVYPSRLGGLRHSELPQ